MVSPTEPAANTASYKSKEDVKNNASDGSSVVYFAEPVYPDGFLDVISSKSESLKRRISASKNGYASSIDRFFHKMRNLKTQKIIWEID